MYLILHVCASEYIRYIISIDSNEDLDPDDVQGADFITEDRTIFLRASKGSPYQAKHRANHDEVDHLIVGGGNSGNCEIPYKRGIVLVSYHFSGDSFI